jgi:hypothetical protein
MELKTEMRRPLDKDIGVYPIFQAGAEYDLLKFLSIGSSYRISYIPERQKENLDLESNNKYRYSFDVKMKTGRFRDIKLKNRFRYQVSTSKNKKNNSFLRNKVILDYRPSKNYKLLTGLEPYYSLKHEKFIKYRLYVGSEFTIRQHDLCIYTIFEKNPEKEEIVSHIVGLSIQF